MDRSVPADPGAAGPAGDARRPLRGFGLVQYTWMRPEGDVPERLWDRAAHADPEFESFTYGDNCEWSPRAAGLRSIERGDVLLFLARLERWDRGTRTRFGFYLVGFLEIDTVLRNVCARPSESGWPGSGATPTSGGASATGDGFWLFSRRFEQADRWTGRSQLHLRCGPEGVRSRAAVGVWRLRAAAQPTLHCSMSLHFGVPWEFETATTE